MEALQQRTLVVGLIISLGIYTLGFASPYVVKGPNGQWVAIGLTAISLLFFAGWFIAVRRGFRLGKQTRQQRRLKERTPPRRFR